METQPMGVPFGTELWDTCKTCGGSILWAWGGVFWLHVKNRPRDQDFHLGEPTIYTEFQNHERHRADRGTP